MRKWKCVLLNCDVSKKPSLQYTLLLDLLSDSPAWIKVPLPQQSSQGPSIWPTYSLLPYLVTPAPETVLQSHETSSRSLKVSRLLSCSRFYSCFFYWSKLVLTLGNSLLALFSMRKWTLSIHCWHLAQCIRHSEHSKCWSYKFIKIKLAYAFKFYFHKDVNLSVCVPAISECTPCMNACL